MPFRATFSCLWCGTDHETRSTDDLEGWAQLCPACVGKAGDNQFLRFRLRQALSERSAAARTDARRARCRGRRRGDDRGSLRVTVYGIRGTCRHRPRPGHGRLLRGACPGIRRLVPPSRPVRTGCDPRRGLERRAGCGGSLARCAAVDRRDRRPCCRDGLVVPAPGIARRAVAVRRIPDRARSRSRAAARARPARAPPCPRRVGRAGPADRRPVHGLLAQPRPARAAHRLPGARTALAQAGRADRVHRFAAGPGVGRGRPSRTGA